jgi:putative transposase
MQGFRPSGGIYHFISIFAAVRNLYGPPRSTCSALATDFALGRTGKP